MIGSIPAKNSVIMVFFALHPGRVLGMTSAGGRANRFQDGQRYRSWDSSPVAIQSK
jgi:hypothetical protein